MSSLKSARMSIYTLVALVFCAPSSYAFDYENAYANENDSEWRFKVYLDDKEIGTHSYQLSPIGDKHQLHTKADFQVRFLFLTAYRYRHVNTEIWSDSCLQSIDAWTDDNGSETEVAGVRKSDAFAVDVDGAEESLPQCVMSFAYWNKDFLDKSVLLNAQTGELLPVEVEKLPDEEMMIDGIERICERYRLTAENVDIEVWYGNDSKWLGLVSRTTNGKSIRYEIT